MQQGKNALSLVKQKWAKSAKFEIVCAKILNTIQPHPHDHDGIST